PVARRPGREDRLLERLQGGRALVGSITSVLGGPRRTLAAAGLALVLLVYYETSTDLWQAGTWADVAWLAIVVIPAVLALIGLVLPLREERWTVWAGLGLAVLAA